MTKERITHAAIKRNDGIISTGKSHFDIILKCPKDSCKGEKVKQGFLTNKNRFVGRKEAAQIAYNVKQIRNKKKELLSEHIWSDNNFKYNSIKGFY
ncbi:hypothetical protein K9M42_02805 [Patescibacteria group bacterium]|nr:hypothetical protein [Patescibacteria group bacterium]